MISTDPKAHWLTLKQMLGLRVTEGNTSKESPSVNYSKWIPCYNMKNSHILPSCQHATPSPTRSFKKGVKEAYLPNQVLSISDKTPKPPSNKWKLPWT